MGTYRDRYPRRADDRLLFERKASRITRHADYDRQDESRYGSRSHKHTHIRHILILWRGSVHTQ